MTSVCGSLRREVIRLRPTLAADAVAIGATGSSCRTVAAVLTAVASIDVVSIDVSPMLKEVLAAVADLSTSDCKRGNEVVPTSTASSLGR